VAKTAWAVSCVEYVKTSYLHSACNDGLNPDSLQFRSEDQIVVIHAGADLFVRKAYSPQKFPLRLAIHSSDGNRRICEKPQEILTDIGM
jgi:hypothetical protein